MALSPALARWARAHHQLITRDAWIADGRSGRSFDRAIARGDLRRMGRNVAALTGSPNDPVSRIAAAVLGQDHPVLASHLTAAFLWGAPVRGVDPVELVTTDRSPVRRPGIVVHRTYDLGDLRPVRRSGIPTTNPLRTLVDVGASDRAATGPTLEAFLIAGLVTAATARGALGRHRGRGRPGVTALADALDSLALDAKPPDSVLETALARLFARHGLTGWVFHHRVLGFELDFAFPLHAVAVEVDGWAYHHTRGQFERDRQRDAALAAAGWVVLRFTWRQVTRQPGRVAETVRATLARRPPAQR